ncbi:hypothetical protein FM107_15000 [Sphingobacterium sp. JB170]|nr:hypothetical protein FM107_15000 [Sphingobacterium sp. JB170]
MKGDNQIYSKRYGLNKFDSFITEKEQSEPASSLSNLI